MHILPPTTLSAATALLLLAAGPAGAADILYEPPGSSYSGGASAGSGLNFDGLYAGVQAGGAFGATDARNQVTSSGSAFTAAGPRSDGSDDSSGGLVGAHLGADFRIGAVVLGAETDYSAVNAGSSARTRFGGNAATVTREVDSVGTTRARAGLASDRLMVYGTAGIAYGRVESRVQLDDPSNLVADDSASKAEMELGTVYGGGVGYMVHDRVSLGAEYTYTDLGEVNFGKRFNESGGGSFEVGESGESIKFHRLEGKLSYHFN